MNPLSTPPCELPDFLKDDSGRLAQFTLPLDTSNGQCHFLTCSGIGDTAWVVSKLWKVAEERDCTFWTPEAGPYNRVDPYLELMGLKHGRMEIDIRRLLELPGEFEEGAFEEGGIFYIHANRHLEAGRKLIDWHPWLPFRNPAPPATMITCGPKDTPLSSDSVFQYSHKSELTPYIVVHMASASYCEGNHFPNAWARMIKWVEENVAPVQLIGAKWDEPMIEKVSEIYRPYYQPCIGQSLAFALSCIVNSSAMIGVDSGLTIMAAYYGIPALRAYPTWLSEMMGTWEDPATLHPHDLAIFMHELMEVYKPWCEGLNFRE